MVVPLIEHGTTNLVPLPEMSLPVAPGSGTPTHGPLWSILEDEPLLLDQSAITITTGTTSQAADAHA